MRHLAALLTLLLPLGALASNRVLLIDDIGSGSPHFSWQSRCDGRVALAVTVESRDCLDENCAVFLSTGPLADLEREAREVYYVRGGGEARIACGRTPGFFLDGSEFYDGCRVSVEPEPVCQTRHPSGECIDAVTRYRVYLTVGN